MNFQSGLSLLAAALLGLGTQAVLNNIDAGPNLLAFNNPNQRTQVLNGTFFIVPAPISAVRSVVPYPLIASCATNRALFPQPLPPNTFPLLVTTGMGFDIRMSSAEIDALTMASVSVPCVDRLADGRTPFQFPLSSFIGGANGMDLMTYVPTTVGSAENIRITPAKMYPDYLAYRPIGPNLFAYQAKALVAPNDASGPGVVPAAIDTTFSAGNSYPATTFYYFLNQPTISNSAGSLLCFRNNYFFNNSFANPVPRTATVTLYGIDAVQPSAIAGHYSNVGAYSADAQNIGYALQDCGQAAAQNNPTPT